MGDATKMVYASNIANGQKWKYPVAMDVSAVTSKEIFTMQDHSLNNEDEARCGDTG